MRRFWILVPFWITLAGYVLFALVRGRMDGDMAKEAVVGVPEVAGTGAPVRSAPEQLELPEEAALTPSALEGAGIRKARLPMEPILADAALAAREASLAGRLFLHPRDPGANPVTFLWPVDAEGNPDKQKLLAAASRDSYPRWKAYEDEWLSFYYPDDPAVVLEILDAGTPFPMLGETMWTVDDSPVRRYRLAAPDGGTHCVISFEKADGFDNTERFPRPEVFRRFLVDDGSLWRASLMGNGHLRRVEILAGGERASVLDWPHCAMHRDVYERLALSVRLNGAVADGEMLAERVFEDGDMLTRLGFLEKGWDGSAVREFLGLPARLEGDHLVYEEGGTAYRVPLEDGCFEVFGKDWRERIVTPPDEGSLAWMLEKTGGAGGDEVTVGFDLGPLTDEEAAAMFEGFCAAAPTVDADGWERWCRLVANLAELRARDERVLGVIGTRFLDPSLPQSLATQILHAYDPDGGRDLFAARLDQILGDGTEGPATPTGAHDAQVLFAYLGREDSRTGPLVERAIRHSDAAVREAGYAFLAWLPEAEGIVFLEKGLADSNVVIRRRSAEALCESEGSAATRAALAVKCLERETDPETRAFLEQSLRQVRDDADGSANGAAPPNTDLPGGSSKISL